VEAAGIEPAPGGAKLPAESRPYLATARNAWESVSRRVPSCPASFQVIPQAPATYVQHGTPSQKRVGLPGRNGDVSGRRSPRHEPVPAEYITTVRRGRQQDSGTKRYLVLP
jgi:hypothetical protein